MTPLINFCQMLANIATHGGEATMQCSKDQVLKLIERFITPEELQRKGEQLKEECARQEEDETLQILGKQVIRELAKSLEQIAALKATLQGKASLGNMAPPEAFDAVLFQIIIAARAFETVAMKPGLNDPSTEANKIVVKYFKILLEIAIVTSRISNPKHEVWYEEWEGALQSGNEAFDFSTELSMPQILNSSLMNVQAVPQVLTRQPQAGPRINGETNLPHSVRDINDQRSASSRNT